MPFDLFAISASPYALLAWVSGLWWLWLFIVLVYVARWVWKAYIQEYYKRITNPWVLLEIHIPREIKNPPKAMEQIFTTFHAIRNSASDFQESWWDGEVPFWFCFEAISFGGELHIYMYIPVVRRSHVEAAFYANYPDIEIREVPKDEDYINRMPTDADELYKAGYRLFGNELVLTKNPVYPIRTYIDFEAAIEEKEIDPVSSLFETLARLKPQEHIWMQILVRPKVDSFIGKFHKAGEDEIDRIKQKARYVRDPSGAEVIDPISGFPLLAFPSPGETEGMKAIDHKISKPAFDVVIRYMYMAPREVFNGSFGRRSIFSVMNQYASESHNKFVHNTYAWTLAKLWYPPYIFPRRRAAARRRWIYEKYRQREMYPDTFTEAILKMHLFHWGIRPYNLSPDRGFNAVLNTEELATIFHMPTPITLTGPLIRRVEARKGGPPAGLPIYGDGAEDLPLNK